MRLFSLVFAMLLPGSLLAQNGTYVGVLKIPALDSAPTHFYIDTNIPGTDAPAPQIHITGYLYGHTNRAMKATLGWYRYQGNFYWSQFHSDLGYVKPSRIRLGTYIKNGADYVRIEISNDGGYWANYTISATERFDAPTYYTGWTYTLGEMPTSTTSQITEVVYQSQIFIDGKLGIGVNNPSEKLAVNGNIRAREVKVEADNWPDYVFEDNYELPSLLDTEQFIEKNKHLPGIPSASEVEKDGLELSKMNIMLLKKVEELTLHLIDQNKKYSLVLERLQKLEKERE